MPGAFGANARGMQPGEEELFERQRALARDTFAKLKELRSEEPLVCYDTAMRKFALAAVAVISLLAGAGIGAAAESNIYAKTANNYLVKAFGEVMAAPPDKGGHRKIAGDYILRAINEVKAWEAE